ncbi:MAG: hypothetical protein V2I82_13935 [Halieaceae bacterium]|jgi:hypothetical protein|nr:hypothetical protein [Halieaceae bacterium]
MIQIAKLTTIALLASFALAAAADSEGEIWWRGNTHTHSWWSDGDAPPELVAEWYKQHGYHFLVISDHNVMQRGEKWYPIDQPPRRPEAVKRAYERYVDRFGSIWVTTRESDHGREVRLKTLDEFRPLFEEPNRFLFINGEEITDRHLHHPVHMNGVNLVEPITPQGGTSVANTIQNNLDAVVAQSHQHAKPMVLHLNHPNFHFAVTAEDFFELDHAPGDGFFEMYNGHSGVNNNGDELHPSAERLWDIVLANRLGRFNRRLIYGVATDDAHEYNDWGDGFTNPGRGWVMVRAPFLTPDFITQAIRRGDFYNSTGVELRKLEISDRSISIEVDEQPGVDYTIEFVGTRSSAQLTPIAGPFTPDAEPQKPARPVYRYSEEIGEVLHRVKGTSASYQATGDELYVRARVVSSRYHPNPFAMGDPEMAWTQPIVVEARDAESNP